MGRLNICFPLKQSNVAKEYATLSMKCVHTTRFKQTNKKNDFSLDGIDGYIHNILTFYFVYSSKKFT